MDILRKVCRYTVYCEDMQIKLLDKNENVNEINELNVISFKIQIVAGAQFLSKDEDNTKQTVTLSELIIHEDYDHNSLGINDICLIKVGTPFSFDEAVAPATMPKQDEQPEGNKKEI